MILPIAKNQHLKWQRGTKGDKLTVSLMNAIAEWRRASLSWSRSQRPVKWACVRGARWRPSGSAHSKHIFRARLIKPPQNKWRPISASEARPVNKATWIDAPHYLVCGSSLNKCLKYRIAQSFCWWNSVLERVQTYSLSLRRDYMCQI